MKKIAFILVLSGLAAAAQNQPQSQSQPQPQAEPSQSQSLGDLARQYRAAKKPGNPVRVVDNDDLAAAPAPEPAKTPDAATADSKPGEPKKGEAKPGDAKEQPKSAADAAKAKGEEWKTKIDAQKKEVALLQRELDVLERESRMRAAAYYADVGAQLRDPATFNDDSRKQQDQIDAKRQALDAAKQKLADLQESARKDGVPSSYID
ncbi:MAG TPA: hypothetical protein VKT33_14160 [Candidatus Angelobacter sp.]|nr:hypothetical protein [Candidatus Angelobacter sp.]